MFSKRPYTLATGTGALIALSCSLLTASGSSAAELVANTPLLGYDLSATAPAPSAADSAAMLQDEETVQPTQTATVDSASVECMAKVVLHEAANQPRPGKVAVAETLVNRLKAGRFGGSICEVVNQKGQYFHIAAFKPRRDTDGWQEAVEVAHEVLAGQSTPVAPGAMFFRASYAPANAFFRTRQRVATVGAHIFYR